MADKNFSIDNILNELRGTNKPNTSSIPDETNKKYSMELKKYDTAALLSDVNHTIKHSGGHAIQQKPMQTTTPLNVPELEESKNNISSSKPILGIYKSSTNPIAVTPQPTPQSPQAVVADPPMSEQFPEQYTEDNFLTSEELAKQELIEKERLRKLMLSTAHLKYISLRKNREKMVQDFVLKPEFTVTQPVEVHKEVRRQNVQQKNNNASDGKVNIEADKGIAIGRNPNALQKKPPQKENATAKKQVESKKGVNPSKTASKNKIQSPQKTPAKKTIKAPQDESKMDKFLNPIRDFFDSVMEKVFPDEQTNTAEETQETNEPTGTPIISYYKKGRTPGNPGAAADRRENFKEYTAPAQKSSVLSGFRSVEKQLTTKFVMLIILFLLSLMLAGLSGVKDGSPLLFLDKAENPIAFCVINLLLLIGCMAICFDTISDGFMSLIKGKPGRNTFYSIAIMFTLVDNLLLLAKTGAVNEESVTLYTSLAILCSLFGLCGRLLNTKSILTNFKFVSNDNEKYAVDILANQRLADDFTKGALEEESSLVYNTKTPFLAGFMDESFKQDKGDHFAKKLLPILSGIAVLVGVISVLRGGSVFVCLSVISGVLLVGTGAISGLMISLPLYEASKSMPVIGGAILGCGGVEAFVDANSVLLNASQIFYGKDVTLYGIRTFSDASIDRVILDATCVLCESKSILGNVFYNMIANPKDALDPIDGVIYEDGMGISAWVGDRRVLIGSRELMTNHNVHVPNIDYEDKYAARGRNLVYLATGGELSAVFVIGLECSTDIRNMITALYNNDIVCIVKTVDPILTRPALASVFNMPEGAFRVIPSRLHKEFNDISDSNQPRRTAVCNNGTLSGYVYSFLGAKRINKIVHWGVMLNYLTLGVGVLLFFMFAAVGGLAQLTPFVLCVYELICVLVYIIIQRFNKT